MCRIDKFSNIHATYSYFFFKLQNGDSQQRAETAAILYFEIRYFVKLGNRRMRNQGHKYLRPTPGNFKIIFTPLSCNVGNWKSYRLPGCHRQSGFDQVIFRHQCLSSISYFSVFLFF